MDGLINYSFISVRKEQHKSNKNIFRKISFLVKRWKWRKICFKDIQIFNYEANAKWKCHKVAKRHKQNSFLNMHYIASKHKMQHMNLIWEMWRNRRDRSWFSWIWSLNHPELEMFEFKDMIMDFLISHSMKKILSIWIFKKSCGNFIFLHENRNFFETTFLLRESFSFHKVCWCFICSGVMKDFH